MFTSIRRNFSRRKKATGITPDEPTELENLLDMIIALEESGEAELQETQGTASKKRQYDRAKVKDVRLKAMEKLSETKKRGSSEERGTWGFTVLRYWAFFHAVFR